MSQTVPQQDEQLDSVTLTFRVSREQARHVRITAAQRDCSMADLFRKAMAEYIGEPPAISTPDPADTQEI